MGAMDWLKEFEGRALDAVAYKTLARNFELQEANSKLLKEQLAFVTDDRKRPEAENAVLRGELAALKAATSRAQEADQFKVYEGLAFKALPGGQYEPTAYCPTCHKIMSNAARCIYNCPACKYVKATPILAENLAGQLSLASGGKPAL